MPIASVFDLPGEDAATYHKVTELGGQQITDQPKRLSHVCYRTRDGFAVVDRWEDEASFAAFGPVIGRRSLKQG
jgi:hypothetical protein